MGGRHTLVFYSRLFSSTLWKKNTTLEVTIENGNRWFRVLAISFLSLGIWGRLASSYNWLRTVSVAAHLSIEVWSSPLPLDHYAPLLIFSWADLSLLIGHTLNSFLYCTWFLEEHDFISWAMLS